MPIFEYACNACHHEFEALVFGKDKAECPKCSGRKLTPKLSVFAVSAKESLQVLRRRWAVADRVAIHAAQAHAPWTSGLLIH